MYVREVSVRYRLRRIRGSPAPRPPLTTPGAAAALLTRTIGHEIVEVAGLLCLNAAHELLGYHELSRGTLTETIVCPLDVYRTALLTQAVVVILGHNHPSGRAAPSGDDVALTQRLAAAGRLIGVKFADHVIVTAEGQYYSFKEAGYL